MSNYGKDAENAALEHMKNIAASEIITKLKKWLSNEPGMASKRWAFELVQNALDSAKRKHNNQVKVELIIENDGNSRRLVFRHNGGPFTHDEACGIIYGGTTKRAAFAPGLEYIGRFGRGFLISHILNRRVELRGIGEDEEGLSHRFDLVLDRSSDDEKELIRQIAQNFDHLANNSPLCDVNPDVWFAEYQYQLVDSRSESAADTGISTLQRLLPLTFAFNSNLVEVRVNDSVYTKDRTAVEQGISIFTTLSNGVQYGDKILVRTDEEAKTAVGVMIGDGSVLQLPYETPRLFVAMPLITSENISIPFCISSPSLSPSEERDTVLLAGNDDTALKNREILGVALNHYHDLLGFCISQGYEGLQHLADYSAVPEEYMDDEKTEYWLFWRDAIKDCVKRLQTISIVKTEGGAITPADVLFPVPSLRADHLEDDLDSAAFSEFYQLVAAIREPIPKVEDAYKWQIIARKWTSIDENLRLNFYSVESLAEAVRSSSSSDGKFLNGDSVSATLGIKREELKDFLLRVVALIDDTYSRDGVHRVRLDLIDGLLLNRSGFVLTKGFSIQDVNDNQVNLNLAVESAVEEIPQELGDITAHIGYDIWQVLVDPSFAGFRIVADYLAHEVTVSEVISEMLRYKLIAKTKADLESQRGLGWARFLIWCICNDHIHADLPIYTEDGLVVSIGSKEHWPLCILPFSEIGLDVQYQRLMPDSRILNQKYFDLLTGSEKGVFIRRSLDLGLFSDHVLTSLGTLKIKKDKLREILVDATTALMTGEHHIVTEEGAISTLLFSDATFGKVSSLPQNSRDFFEFVVRVICEQDNSWLTSKCVRCSCGSRHLIHPSEWLAEIKAYEWVALQKDDDSPISHRKANKDTLDEMLSTEGITSIIQYRYGIDLLSHFGYDKLDLTVKRRVQGTQEEQELREQLSRVVETGVDVDSLIQYINDSERNRHAVAENQAIGTAVEQIIQEILRSRGITSFKTTGIGSDFEIWPEEDGCDCGRVDIESYLVEIKFTTGNRARLSRKQAETAIAVGPNYFVLVVHGDRMLRDRLRSYCDELTVDQRKSAMDEVLRQIVLGGHLSDRLISAPMPDEIEPDLNGYWIKEAFWSRGQSLPQWLSSYIEVR